MEKLGSINILRKCADALEDKRRAENVARLEYFSSLNQNMLLALNGAKSRVTLPELGIIMDGLKERLITVATSDEQSAVLGMFYTNLDPFSKRNPKVVTGIFPLYAESVEYMIRPRCYWQSEGTLTITDESVTREDPFLMFNSKGPDFLFFKKSPFVYGNPYITELPLNNSRWLSEPGICDLALEENVALRALWHINIGNKKPRLFEQTGFARFINSHCSDPDYIELHAAFTQLRNRKCRDNFSF